MFFCFPGFIWKRFWIFSCRYGSVWNVLGACSAILGPLWAMRETFRGTSWSSCACLELILERTEAPGPPNTHLPGTCRGPAGDLPGTCRGAAGGPNRQFGLRWGELKGGNLTRLMTPQGGRRIRIKMKLGVGGPKGGGWWVH